MSTNQMAGGQEQTETIRREPHVCWCGCGYGFRDFIQWSHDRAAAERDGVDVDRLFPKRKPQYGRR